MSNPRVIKVGVIGAGRIGKIHAENLATRIPGVEVVAIADPNVAAAKELAEELHVSSYSEDYRKILDDKSIEAVLICSSTDTHARFMTEAAEAGKHIFCEKPVDHSLEKIDAALAAVKKAGVKCQIGFNRRFDPNFKKVRQMVNEGKVGEVQILRITSRDPAPPPVSYVKVSGGMFLDMTIHDFDMARYLSGSEVVEVYAAGAVMVDPGIGEAGDIDTAVITLKFANGSIGTIDNSRKAIYGYDQRVEVFGSKGMVAVANNTANSSVYSNEDGVVSEKPLYFFLERYMDSFIAELSDFIDAVRDDKPTPVTALDGRKPVVIAMAANKSLKENRSVKLSEIE
ncbi:MAG: inositol 2-dehydrogenase [Chloroflexi bacterium HGW-Chloroflexi-4]|jgi:myo-inositol 2-dehydrogenase/D-chiro-inositol 1-dehydrogenase|nr:MAG: inositol 2-dehydrogenase [Chloroflexi bacterium HGW-Chloroflexi-4]